MLCRTVLSEGPHHGQNFQPVPLPSAGVAGVEGVEGVEAHRAHQVSFNALFLDSVAHRPQIGLALQDLVHRVARRVRFPSAQCRAELSRDIYLHCLEILDQYYPTHGHAYRWFALAARREFWLRLGQERRRRTCSLGDVDHDAARLRPLPSLAGRHRAAPLVSARLGLRFTTYLDDLLQRTLARHGQAATAADAQLTRGMVLALQEVRHRVAGTYRPLTQAGLVYTQRHRVEQDDANDETAVAND